MSTHYFEKVTGGSWSVGRRIGKGYVSLVEGCATDLPVVHAVCVFLGLEIDEETVKKYFPCGKVTHSPTRELLTLFAGVEEHFDGGISV